MAGRLDGKVAMVTSSSGIGLVRAAVRERGREGRYRRSRRDASRRDRRRNRGRGRAGSVSTHRHERRSRCEELAEECVRRFGKLDVLLAAAGISHALYVSGSEPTEVRGDRAAVGVMTKPTEYWEKVLNVNLTGVMMTGAGARRAG